MTTKLKFTSDIKVRLIQEMGGDHMVIAAARVSTSGEEAAQYARQTCPGHSTLTDDYKTCKYCVPFQERFKEGAGLIRYLMKMRHGTPFEHSTLTFFVHAPIFVWREWHRHRVGFSYNEESGRYKQLDPVFYIPPRDRPMIKVEDWKPGRPKFMTLDEHYGDALTGYEDGKDLKADRVYDEIVSDMCDGYRDEYARYLRQLGRSLDPGLARDNLPVGIYSSCWVTCNPRSLMHFLSLRTHEPDAKAVSYPLYEIEVAARAAEEIFQQGWPVTHAAFVECGRVAP